VTRFAQINYSTGTSWQNLGTEYSKIVDKPRCRCRIHPIRC